METISVCIPSHNTLSRGEEVLKRAVNSISTSIKYLYSQRNDVKVIISWVDDASTDETVNEIKRLRELQEPIIKDNFFITPLQINKGQAYCRNLAATLYKSDFICLFDSDDEMYENHISICYDLMNVKNEKGEKFGLASTSIDTSEEDIHPYWRGAISDTAPNTKIIRRDVWEFIEGMPMDFIYKKIGQEDEAFIMIYQNFFYPVKTEIITGKYWNYPGSNLDKQIKKFQTDPNNYLPELETKEDKKSAFFKDLFINKKIEYLEQKIKVLNLYDKFDYLMKKF